MPAILLQPFQLKLTCNAGLAHCLRCVFATVKASAAGIRLPPVTCGTADALNCCAARWLSFVFALITCLNKATLVANTVAADPFIQARSLAKRLALILHEIAADIELAFAVLLDVFATVQCEGCSVCLVSFCNRLFHYARVDCDDRRGVGIAAAAKATSGSAFPRPQPRTAATARPPRREQRRLGAERRSAIAGRRLIHPCDGCCQQSCCCWRGCGGTHANRGPACHAFDRRSTRWWISRLLRSEARHWDRHHAHPAPFNT